jgi:activator of HSP90 ATPase
LWDGSITGKNIAFIENKMLQQEWYFEEEEKDLEPSIVTIKLHEKGNNTSVELVHTNIPDDAFENICEGWQYSYFNSLIDFYTED